MNDAAPADTTWRTRIYPALKTAGVGIVAYVPDAGHSETIDAAIADPEVTAVSCTSEEEGIGIACGAHLGGTRAALLMQSSGVGNCINVLGPVVTCRFPLLVLVTMRGEWAEFNPWQNPMGQATEGALKLMDVLCFRADKAEDVLPQTEAAIDMAFNGDQACAVILGQRLIGRKVWVK